MKLISIQHVGTRKTYRLNLAADDGAEHPIAKPEWRVLEHRGANGEPSVRPLAEIAPAADGHSVMVHTLAWPGVIEISATADAMHPPADQTAMPRTTKFTSRLVIVIPEIPELAETLALRITPAAI